MSSPGRTSFPVAEYDDNWMNITSKRPKSSIGPDLTIETIQMMSRHYNASNFGRNYKFVDGRKTCIYSDGNAHSWPDKCYDRIWVGVHGKESICIVTMKQDVDMTRVGDPFYHDYCENHQTMRSYASAIISEVECLPYDDKMRERFNKSIKKPFGVVSVIPCTVHEGSSHEASSAAEYDAEKAIKYLEEKMKSDLAFTHNETIQTAISAFQHLLVKELKAEDIWVSSAFNDEGTSEHMDLPVRKEHLAIIRGESSGEGLPRKIRLSVDPNPPDVTESTMGPQHIFFCTPYVGDGGGFTGDFDEEPPDNHYFSADHDLPAVPK